MQYGNAEKISWLLEIVKSYIRGVTGDTSKGYGNNYWEIKFGIIGVTGRGGLDFLAETGRAKNAIT